MHTDDNKKKKSGAKKKGVKKVHACLQQERRSYSQIYTVALGVNMPDLRINKRFSDKDVSIHSRDAGNIMGTLFIWTIKQTI